MQPPPYPITQPDPAQDENHLSLLSTFHYIVGGLTCLFACIPLIHLTIGLLMLTGGLAASASTTPGAPISPDGAPLAIIGGIFAAIGGSVFLIGQALGISILLAGRNIALRRRYNFAFVVACIECLIMPFGTILGVFTIIVLSRPTIKPLFQT